jgi:PKD repeat protein
MRVFFFFLVSLFSAHLIAQSHNHEKCGTEILEQQMRNNSSQDDENLSNFDYLSQQVAQLGEYDATENVIVVPVVVHVMYADQSDNISDDQILDAIDVLNTDFRRQNADTTDTRAIFKGVAADTEIEFRLARKDENGNCTKGITRKQTSLAIDAHDNVKPLRNWNHKMYLNIWTVRNIQLPGGPSTGTILGYAYRPNPGQHYTKDGVVIRHDMMGRIGTATGIGRTLTHEVGHYLGLRHPFDNGCFGGDNCTDTPPVASASSGCNLNRNSCSNDSPDLPDQIENFMDYADDHCTNMLTQQQRNIMRNSLGVANLRGYLVQNNNPQNTGIVEGQPLACAPEAKFTASQTQICEGESIQFTDQTFFGNPTTYNWQFQGGTPSTSNAKNPTVQYNTPGTYNATLNVSNASGASQMSKQFSISVRPNSPIWINQFSDDFEAWNVPNNNWHVEVDADTIDFFTTHKTGFNSAKSVKLNNININSARTVSLITNAINLENTKNVSLSFDFAYAKRQGVTSADVLKIYISADCGKTWNIKRNIAGSLLTTTGDKSGSFEPANNGEWRKGNFPLIGISYVPSLMVKFEFVASGGGNNLYIDNVEFLTTISIEEEERGFREINLFPNPSNGVVNIEFDVLQSDAYSINAYDLSGKQVALLMPETKLSQGTFRFQSEQMQNLSPGIYLIEIKNSKSSKIEKLVIQ